MVAFYGLFSTGGVGLDDVNGVWMTSLNRLLARLGVVMEVCLEMQKAGGPNEIATSHDRLAPQKVAFRKGHPLISGKSWLVKYHNLARMMDDHLDGGK